MWVALWRLAMWLVLPLWAAVAQLREAARRRAAQSPARLPRQAARLPRQAAQAVPGRARRPAEEAPDLPLEAAERKLPP